MEGNDRLSPRARGAIEDQANDRFLSIASVWEVAIKLSLGKLTVGQPLGQFVDEQTRVNGVTILAVGVRDCIAVSSLVFHHRDPFDRLLVAQALSGGMASVSADAVLDAYGLTRIW